MAEAVALPRPLELLQAAVAAEIFARRRIVSRLTVRQEPSVHHLQKCKAVAPLAVILAAVGLILVRAEAREEAADLRLHRASDLPQYSRPLGSSQ